MGRILKIFMSMVAVGLVVSVFTLNVSNPSKDASTAPPDPEFIQVV